MLPVLAAIAAAKQAIEIAQALAGPASEIYVALEKRRKRAQAILAGNTEPTIEQIEELSTDLAKLTERLNAAERKLREG